MKKQKGLLEGRTYVNQIVPILYHEFWDLFLQGQKNNWVPTEVPMQRDIEQWKTGQLSDDERLLVKRCVGFFAGGESMVNNNLMGICNHLTNAEAKQYIDRQIYEEALHNQTIVYICESLGLNQEEVGKAYRTIPAIVAKNSFLIGVMDDLHDPELTGTDEGKRILLRNIFMFYIIQEGVFFYSGFAMLLSLGRQQKMPGISEQIQYTLRDETLHIKFGTLLINEIRKEYPSIWTSGLESDFIRMMDRAVELEIQYARDVLPRGILGLNADMFVDYMRYIGDRRFESLGIDHRLNSKGNPFQWMSEAIDLDKRKNFFETRVTEYQSGAVIDDL